MVMGYKPAFVGSKNGGKVLEDQLGGVCQGSTKTAKLAMVTMGLRHCGHNCSIIKLTRNNQSSSLHIVLKTTVQSDLYLTFTWPKKLQCAEVAGNKIELENRDIVQQL